MNVACNTASFRTDFPSGGTVDEEDPKPECRCTESPKRWQRQSSRKDAGLKFGVWLGLPSGVSFIACCPRLLLFDGIAMSILGDWVISVFSAKLRSPRSRT